MKKMKLAMVAVCLTGALAAGCSLAQPKPRDFTLVDQHPAQAKQTGNTFEAAEAACKEESKKKGISSIVGIFSRLRKGAADEDYIACMKGRGYEVTN
jgi:hypothetical protein